MAYKLHTMETILSYIIIYNQNTSTQLVGAYILYDILTYWRITTIRQSTAVYSSYSKRVKSQFKCNEK